MRLYFHLTIDKVWCKGCTVLFNGTDSGLSKYYPLVSSLVKVFFISIRMCGYSKILELEEN